MWVKDKDGSSSCHVQETRNIDFVLIVVLLKVYGTITRTIQSICLGSIDFRVRKTK